MYVRRPVLSFPEKQGKSQTFPSSCLSGRWPSRPLSLSEEQEKKWQYEYEHKHEYKYEEEEKEHEYHYHHYHQWHKPPTSKESFLTLTSRTATYVWVEVSTNKKWKF